MAAIIDFNQQGGRYDNDDMLDKTMTCGRVRGSCCRNIAMHHFVENGLSGTHITPQHHSDHCGA